VRYVFKEGGLDDFPSHTTVFHYNPKFCLPGQTQERQQVSVRDHDKSD